jgi:cholesterol transport system auxiliary component
MTRPAALLRLAAAAAAAAALSGCISLLPKAKPVTLYRFGAPPAAAAPEAPQDSVGVFLTHGSFEREAAGDRILTVDGGKVAYVAETRWAAPAAVLWGQAVAAAFDADPGPARLVSRGEPARADYMLRLDVRTFETRYANGPKAPPSVVVRVRAALTRNGDRSLVSEKIFESKVDVSRNRMRAIVPAYDRAVGEVLGDLVAWVNAQATPPAGDQAASPA